MSKFERVLWTFLAGQPISMVDVDKDMMAMIPGPISSGEKGLGDSDTRVDDQTNLPQAFQSMSETFGLVRTRIDIKDDHPNGRISTARRPVHDRLEVRTIGVDTRNQRAARLWFSGSDEELWEYIHEKGNGFSEGLKHTKFLQTRRSLVDDCKLRHVVAASIHRETRPTCTIAEAGDGARLTRERERERERESRAGPRFSSSSAT